MDIGDKDQEASEFLAALNNTELGSLFDGIDGVATCVGEPDDSGLGCLRLQQEGREVLTWEGMANLAEHLAAALKHNGLRIALKCMAKGIVRREEEPSVSALLDEGIARAVGQGPCVVDPMD